MARRPSEVVEVIALRRCVTLECTVSIVLQSFMVSIVDAVEMFGTV